MTSTVPFVMPISIIRRLIAPSPSIFTTLSVEPILLSFNVCIVFSPYTVFLFFPILQSGAAAGRNYM